MGHAHRKHVRLSRLKSYLIRNGPCQKKELIEMMGVDQSCMHRYLIEIEAEKVGHGLWTYSPNDEEIELARIIVEKYIK